MLLLDRFVAPIKSDSLVPVQAFNQTVVKQSKRRLDSRSQKIDVPDELCGKVVTPECLQKMYNIPSTPATAPGNSIAVSSFGVENAISSDLQVRLSRGHLPRYTLLTSRTCAEFPLADPI